jgi:hypothetical protein
MLNGIPAGGVHVGRRGDQARIFRNAFGDLQTLFGFGRARKGVVTMPPKSERIANCLNLCRTMLD